MCDILVKFEEIVGQKQDVLEDPIVSEHSGSVAEECGWPVSDEPELAGSVLVEFPGADSDDCWSSF